MSLRNCLRAAKGCSHGAAESARIVASTESFASSTNRDGHQMAFARLGLQVGGGDQAAGAAGTKETRRVPRDRSSYTGFGHRSFRSHIASELAMVGEGPRHDLRRRQAAIVP